MDTTTLVVFLLVVAIGSWVQTVTGFALGLIVMGAVTVFGLAPVAFSAIVVSIMALVNTLLALQREQHHIDWSMTVRLVAGLLPAIVFGVLLLNHLSAASVQLLHMLLGGFILVSGILLMLRPHPRKHLSPGYVSLLIGAVAGLFGGLFSTAGPPVVYHLYRQPLAIPVIRTTLLATFAISTVGRIGYVGLMGDLTREVLVLSLLCIPVVVVVTLLGKKYRPPLPDLQMRRFAFALLMLLGALLLLSPTRT